MASEPGHLIDTNILLRLSKKDDPKHVVVQAAVDDLTRRGAQLYYTAQNISEFWNVCTRPASHNGFGLSIEETDARVHAIERIMTLLPDNAAIYRVWRQLVVRNRVNGVQVHDARLAAAMQVHGISHILTLNQPDFVRYTGINVVHP
jgi:predicted nucleic acid-binding protein